MNGRSATARSQPITVHRPTSLEVVSDTGSVQDFDCLGLVGLDYCGVRRDVLYRVFGQLGTSIPIADLPAEESFIAGTNTCAGVPDTPTPSGGQTLGDGTFSGPDRIAMCSSSCLPRAPDCRPTGSCTLSFRQNWTVSGLAVRANNISITCGQVSIVAQ